MDFRADLGMSNKKNKSFPISDKGISIVSFALVLPIFLLVIFATIELFLYYRAVSAVSLAAAEAGKIARSSFANKEDAARFHDLDPVKRKAELSTSSGGSKSSNIKAAFQKHGVLYEAPPGRSANSRKLPFPLAPETLKPDPETGNPGVQHLPIARVWTCLEPFNESFHTIEDCSKIFASTKRAGFLNYELPARLDFDGDGSEDFVAFYPNSRGADWWVLPSSSGTLFRYALEFELGNTSTALPTKRLSLACPADYDDDGLTDFCSINHEGNKKTLSVRFSSQQYGPHQDYRLNVPQAGLLLPVAGPWTKEGPDQFAAILLETKDSKHFLSTYIWPPFSGPQATERPDRAFYFQDSPRKQQSSASKPAPGRNWRPAFADHDGSGSLDIGWLTWEAGYPSRRVAGKEAGIEKGLGVKAALEAKLSPWALLYPQGSDSPGLFVVERNNHRVSLITSGDDGVLNGEGDGENYLLIAGSSTENPSQEFPSPDPSARGRFGLIETPKYSSENSCPSCYPGGAYSGDGKLAKNARLNSPRGLAIGERGALFIADYGNARVRLVTPGSDGIVNGKSGEKIETIAGGAVAQGVSCPEPRIGGAAPSSGERPLQWDEYSLQARSAGLPASCVELHPISLALDETSQVLFIGDEQGVIFALHSGQDKTLNASVDEKLFLIQGRYAQLSDLSPANEEALGFANSLFFHGDSLYALLRTSGLSSNRSRASGGILKITPNSGWFSEGELKRELIAGNWVSESSRTPAFGLAKRQHILNPLSFVPYPKDTKKNDPAGFFVTSWWSNEEESIYENALLEVYQNSKGTALRWLSNPHSLSWGTIAPSNQAEYFEKNEIKDQPLANLPLEPSAGVAISPERSYLYFSQTRTGQIFVVELDQDADGKHDLSEDNEDTDRDGDLIPNSSDPFPYAQQVKSKVRSMERFQDPLLWVTNPGGKLNASGLYVDRLEWWLDRFAEVDRAPYSSSETLTPKDQAPYTLLSEETIIISLPRGAMNSSPVWPNGVYRNTEFNERTKLPKLSPLILASLSPREDQIKFVSGYDHCTDWSADENKSKLDSSGKPVSGCGRSLSEPVYPDGRTIGIRRSHLALWKNHWHPFEAADKGKSQLNFLDWDGDGVRNPVVLKGGQSRPLMAYIGNLSLQKGSRKPQCPGDFAFEELAALSQVLRTRYHPGLGVDEQQYSCSLKKRRFFTGLPVPIASVMLDTHAEWQTSVIEKYSDLPGQKSVRFALGKKTLNKLDGPVAQAAYTVLGSALKVKRKGKAKKAGDADVNFSFPKDKVHIQVNYMFPLNRAVAKLFGKEEILITAENQQVLPESLTPK